MAALSQSQALSVAQQAGFSGTSLSIIVAIATAESGLNPGARGVNTDGSVDRGIVQINNRAHAEVSDACAYDPACAFGAAYRISRQGSNFQPWVTYQTGAYKQYLRGNASTGTTLGLGAWSEAKAQALWPWLFPFAPPHITGTYNPPEEYGVDLQMVIHTPVTSLTAGTVLDVWYYAGGGVVVVQSQLRNAGQAAVYYQHLDIATVRSGEIVKVGDQIGLSGGQLSGGYHPATRQYSSGPHIEVGYNCGSGYSKYHSLGPSADPRPWLRDIILNGPPANDTVSSNPVTAELGYIIHGVDLVATGTGPAMDNFADICSMLDYTEEFETVDFNGPIWDVPGKLISWVAGNTEALVLRQVIIGLGFILVIAFVAALVSEPLKAVGPLAIQTVGALG